MRMCLREIWGVEERGDTLHNILLHSVYIPLVLITGWILGTCVCA